MNKPLLLDFDGVIFRNKAALKAVEKKSTEFTRKFAAFRHEKSFDYRPYGHTVRMINALKGVGPDITLQDYNYFVFDREVLSCVKDSIRDDDMLRARMWEHLISRNEHGAHIFSNAPDVWVRCVLSFLDLEESFEGKWILCPKTLDHLKPNEEAYKNALDKVGTKDLLFVDDSEVNYMAARELQIPSMIYTDQADRHLIEKFLHIRKS